MRLVYTFLTAAVFFCGTLYAAEASAQVNVYTDLTSFNSATAGDTTYGFGFSSSGPLSSPYAQGPVTFSSSRLFGYTSGYSTPFISDNDNGGAASNTFSISSTTSALGLTLGSYYGPGSGTYSYIVNGMAGVITVPFRSNTAFLGFTSATGPVSVTFTVNGGTTGTTRELDVTQFIAGTATAPEPATWAMMIVGFGGIGSVMRRTARRSRVRSDAAVI